LIASGKMPGYPEPGFVSTSDTVVDVTTMLTEVTFRRRMLEAANGTGRILAAATEGF